MIGRDQNEMPAVRQPARFLDLPRRRRQELRRLRRHIDQEKASRPVVPVDDPRIVLLLLALLLELGLRLLRPVGDRAAVGRPLDSVPFRFLLRDALGFSRVGAHHPQPLLAVPVREKRQPTAVGRPARRPFGLRRAGEPTGLARLQIENPDVPIIALSPRRLAHGERHSIPRWRDAQILDPPDPQRLLHRQDCGPPFRARGSDRLRLLFTPPRRRDPRRHQCDAKEKRMKTSDVSHDFTDGLPSENALYPRPRPRSRSGVRVRRSRPRIETRSRVSIRPWHDAPEPPTVLSYARTRTHRGDLSCRVSAALFCPGACSPRSSCFRPLPSRPGSPRHRRRPPPSSRARPFWTARARPVGASACGSKGTGSSPSTRRRRRRATGSWTAPVSSSRRGLSTRTATGTARSSTSPTRSPTRARGSPRSSSARTAAPTCHWKSFSGGWSATLPRSMSPRMRVTERSGTR